MINKPDRAVFLLYLPFFAIVFAGALDCSPFEAEEGNRRRIPRY